MPKLKNPLKRTPTPKAIQPPKPSNLISTGSTRLDLAISGGVNPEGGVPTGIIMEIFGPPSLGKTAILSEMAASCQIRGGKVFFLDPESRFNEEYGKRYGFNIDTNDPKQYRIPDTVEEMFSSIEEFETDPTKPNLVCGDSIAALTTETELKTGDKMGMKKAKEMSRLLRIYGRYFQKKNILLALSNQERQGDHGWFVPGGNAIPYWSSLRVRLFKPKEKFELTTSIAGNDRTYGISPIAKIVKSTVDDPFRMAQLSIIFGYGIDDILDCINFLMETRGLFNVGGKEYKTAVAARKFMDSNCDLIDELRGETIKEWKNQEAILWERIKRGPKIRR